MQINALFCMDKDDWKLEFIGSFPGENYYTAGKYSLYYSPAETNDCLYFPPFMANDVAVLSLIDVKIEKVKLIDRQVYNGGMNFIGAIARGDYVYFSPYLYPAIVRMNTKTRELSYFSDWVEPLSKLTSNTQHGYFGYPILVGNSIWIASLRGNAVIEFNTETCKSTVHEVGDKNFCYHGICYDGDNFWLTPYVSTETPVIKWYPKSGDIKEYPNLNLDNGTRVWLIMTYSDDHIWLFPVTSKKAIRISKQTDVISNVDEDKTYSTKNDSTENSAQYFFIHQYGDSIYKFNCQKGTLIEDNYSINEYREETIDYSHEQSVELEKLYARVYSFDRDRLEKYEYGYYYEGNSKLIGSFVAYVLGNHDEDEAAMHNHRLSIARSLTDNIDGTSGQEIYSYIKRYMLG